VIRPGLKNVVSTLLAWSGGASLIGHMTGKRREPLILGYHRVVEDFESESRHAIAPLLVSVRTLIGHVEWVSKRFEICSLDDIHSCETRRKGRPPAALTFDDGYADVFANAFPVLEKMGIPFTVFVTTDLVGREFPFMHDELYARLSMLLDRKSPEAVNGVLTGLNIPGVRLAVELPSTAMAYRLTRHMLKTLPRDRVSDVITALRDVTDLPDAVMQGARVMDWDMIRALQRAGVIIGCHSRRHVLLPNEDAEVVREETEGARAILEEKLGRRVEHFAYPDGAYDEASVEAVARARYRYAYTVDPTRNYAAGSNLTIPRRMMWERDTKAYGRFSHGLMTCRVNGVFDIGRSIAGRLEMSESYRQRGPSFAQRHVR